MRLLSALVVLILASAVRADWYVDEAAEEEGTTSQRILHVFDFEERDDGNFEDLPMYFSRVDGIGMPHWVGGRLSRTHARSGSHSFQLKLDGGSASYRLATHVLPAVPGAHYRLDGFAKTTPLQFARARLTAFITDDAGRTLPGSVRHSRPFVSDSFTADDWSPVSVETHTDDPAAAWIVIEVGLLQPNAGGVDAETPEASDDLLRFRQDVDGIAWFDDLVVSRIPQLHVSRENPSGVWFEGDTIGFRAAALDPSADDLLAAAAIRDATGAVVWRDFGTSTERARSEGIHEIDFDFEIDPLPPGWYSAEIVVAGRSDLLRDVPVAAARRTSSFVVLADLPALVRPDQRFAIDATHVSTDDWPALAELLRPLGAGRAELALWGGPAANDVGLAVDKLDIVAEGLRREGVAVTGVFGGPTPALESLVGGAGWSRLADALEQSDSPAQAGWRSALGSVVSRHAHKIDRWQIGTVGDADAFASDPKLRRLYGRFASVIGSLVSTPAFAIPWPTRQTIDVEPQPELVLLDVAADVPPSQIPLYVADAATTLDAEIAVRLAAGSVDDYGRLEALADLVRRVTLTLASGAGRLTLPLPVDSIDASGNQTMGPEPSEAYVVLRTLMSSLSGKRYQGRVPAGDVNQRVEAFLFADPSSADSRGTLVIWTDAELSDGVEGRVTLEMNLGPGAEQVDLWGNRRPLRQTATGQRDGRADVIVGRLPSFIVGVDAPLTRIRQTVRLDNPLIESSFRPHPRALIMTNTFPRPISGTIHLQEPEGWEAELTSRVFSLNPGETMVRPVTLRIPYNSDAGRHRLTASIQLRTGGGGGGTTGTGFNDREEVAPTDVVEFDVPIEVRLGLADIGLRTLSRREGSDLVVEQTITNYGVVPIDYEAFILVPGRARQERLVTNLGAGRETTRIYRFPGAGDLPSGSSILSGLRELEGTRILNDRVEL